MRRALVSTLWATRLVLYATLALLGMAVLAVAALLWFVLRRPLPELAWAAVLTCFGCLVGLVLVGWASWPEAPPAEAA